MKNRQEKKLQTRQALMSAALDWVEEGQDLSSLSIREVAKRAGVVPTAFYRHFKDLDELALNLVDQLSLVLRQLMREVRQNRVSPNHIIRDSVAQYFDFVVRERVMFIFMAQSLASGTLVVRRAIRSELQFFVNELVADLRRMNLVPHLSVDMMDTIADLTISHIAYSTMHFLDEVADSAQGRDIFERRMVRQLQVIFIGALNWRSEGLPEATGDEASS